MWDSLKFMFQAWFCNECVLILGRRDAAAVQQVQDMISIPDDQRTIVLLYYKSEISIKQGPFTSWNMTSFKMSLGACKSYVKQRCHPKIAKIDSLKIGLDWN